MLPLNSEFRFKFRFRIQWLVTYLLLTFATLHLTWRCVGLVVKRWNSSEKFGCGRVEVETECFFLEVCVWVFLEVRFDLIWLRFGSWKWKKDTFVRISFFNNFCHVHFRHYHHLFPRGFYTKRVKMSWKRMCVWTTDHEKYQKCEVSTSEKAQCWRKQSRNINNYPALFQRVAKR